MFKERIIYLTFINTVELSHIFFFQVQNMWITIDGCQAQLLSERFHPVETDAETLSQAVG